MKTKKSDDIYGEVKARVDRGKVFEKERMLARFVA
jgi:hypothetical protein